MAEPDFSFEGVAEKDCFSIKDGDYVIETIKQAVESGSFNGLEFSVSDENNNDYYFECCGFLVMERLGKHRLYFAVKDLDEETGSLHGAYIVKRNEGEWLLVQETDDAIYAELVARFNNLRGVASEPANTEPVNTEPVYTEPVYTEKKKSGKGWKIAFAIIAFPFWLLWQFIKALLQLFNIGFGDSSTVKAFKRGFNGDSAPYKEYTFTNDMGCQQTVYSDNGRDFYDANGSYVGSSDDDGKTIK